MPSTYSPDLRIELIANGDQSGTWGTTTNSNLGTLIEDAISALASVSVTTANQALTALNGAADEARCASVDLTTTTVANFAVYVPPVTKLYTVRNSSSYVATVYASTVIGNTTAAGTGIAIPAGKSVLLRCDGTNIIEQIDYKVGNFDIGGNLAVAGIPTGPTAAPGTNNTQLATTAFVAAATSDALQDPGGNGIVVRTAGNTTTNRTVTAGSGISVTNGDGVAGNPTIANSGVLTVNGSSGAVVAPPVANASTAAYPSTVGNTSGTPMVYVSGSTFRFTVPAGVTKIKASFVGGGGGAGGANNSNAPGGGGGGAGIVAYLPVTAGLVLTITLGVGGTEDVNGANSTLTGTGISLTAGGGVKGVTPYNGGAGGTGTITTLPSGGVAYVVQGSAGQSGAASVSGIGGGQPSGGSSMLGGGDAGSGGNAGWGGGAAQTAQGGSGFCVIEY